MKLKTCLDQEDPGRPQSGRTELYWDLYGAGPSTRALGWDRSGFQGDPSRTGLFGIVWKLQDTGQGGQSSDPDCLQPIRQPDWPGVMTVCTGTLPLGGGSISQMRAGSCCTWWTVVLGSGGRGTQQWLHGTSRRLWPLGEVPLWYGGAFPWTASWISLPSVATLTVFVTNRRFLTGLWYLILRTILWQRDPYLWTTMLDLTGRML